MEKPNREPADINAIPVRAIVLYEVDSGSSRTYFGTIEDIVDGKTQKKLLLTDKNIINLQKILAEMIVRKTPSERGFVGLVPKGLLAVNITPIANDFCFIMEPMEVTLNLNGKKDKGWFPRTLWTVVENTISVHCLASSREDMDQEVYNFPMPHNNAQSMCTGSVQVEKLKTVKHIDDAMNRIVKGILEAKISHVMVKDFEERWNASKQTKIFSTNDLQKIGYTLKRFLVWRGFIV